jgi:hypothetical protein
MKIKENLEFTKVEDIALLKACERVIVDVMTDNDQTRNKYWQRNGEKLVYARNHHPTH